jgi:glycosyltransferase involved in cell wall biosynthesis
MRLGALTKRSPVCRGGMNAELAIEGARPIAGIDIAIPCYQYGRFLRGCVESVLAQPVERLRVLIIDNASTDDSLEIAQQLATENSAVQVVAHPRNLGHHASYNEAIDWADQKYFLLLCADDLVAPGSLARAVAILERHPEAVMSYGRAALLGPEELLLAPGPDSDVGSWRILSGDALLRRFCGSAVCHISGCTVVVRTEVQKRVGYYRPGLPHTDDLELWLRFACQGAAAETSAIQGGFRAHEASRSAYIHKQHRWDILNCEAAFMSFFAQEGGHLADAARLRRLATRSLGERAFWSAAAHFTRGQIAECFAILRIALRLRPSCALLPPLSYLIRREDTRVRLRSVLAELAGKPRVLTSSLRAEG